MSTSSVRTCTRDSCLRGDHAGRHQLAAFGFELYPGQANSNGRDLRDRHLIDIILTMAGMPAKRGATYEDLLKLPPNVVGDKVRAEPFEAIELAALWICRLSPRTPRRTRPFQT